MNVSLIWNKSTKKKYEKIFADVQSYIDKTCVQKMTPLVPVGLPRYRNSGRLRDSVRIDEPGKIVYTSPRARHDYYATVNHAHGGNPKAQRMWFEVMKSADGKAILRGASEIIRSAK